MARESTTPDDDTPSEDEAPDGLLLALALAQHHIDPADVDDDTLSDLLAELKGGTDPTEGVEP